MERFVVIVEDTESLASSLALAVETIPGVKALIAHHPETALQLVASHSGIVAILTDLNLPCFDGFQLIERVRRLQACKSLPVIMITAEEDAKMPDDGSQSRPNVILRKPFSPREVRRVLQSLLP
jgi:two-component system chemotaxis response regulator CheY